MTYEVMNVTPDTPEWLLERRSSVGASEVAAVCIAPGCKKRPIAKSMCNLHQLRMRSHGSFNLPGPTPLRERLMRKVRKTTSCWVWEGAVGSHGYGMIGLGRRTDGTDVVHRVAYREFVGEIPDGLHIDHLCNVRLCVNPDHLEAVTKAENDRRRDERKRVYGLSSH